MVGLYSDGGTVVEVITAVLGVSSLGRLIGAKLISTWLNLCPPVEVYKKPIALLSPPRDKGPSSSAN